MCHALAQLADPETRRLEISLAIPCYCNIKYCRLQCNNKALAFVEIFEIEQTDPRSYLCCASSSRGRRWCCTSALPQCRCCHAAARGFLPAWSLPASVTASGHQPLTRLLPAMERKRRKWKPVATRADRSGGAARLWRPD